MKSEEVYNSIKDGACNWIPCKVCLEQSYEISVWTIPTKYNLLMGIPLDSRAEAVIGLCSKHLNYDKTKLLQLILQEYAKDNVIHVNVDEK